MKRTVPFLITLCLVFCCLNCVYQPDSPDYEDFDETGSNDQEADDLLTFELFQNQPNPFASATLIQFRLEDTSFVTLKVNILHGELVLYQGLLPGPETHYHVFNPPETLPDGDYFYTLSVYDRYLLKKMTLKR